MKFLFLYTELAGYLLACVKKLAEQYDAEVHIFRYPVNREAPFRFEIPDNIFFYEKRDFDREKLTETVLRIMPDVIYCAGWTDKDYLHIVRRYSWKKITILGFDNKWENTLRQNVASVLSPFFIKKYFSHCFVPGEKQKAYASKLGFKQSSILTGLYSADFDLFHAHYGANKEKKKDSFPKKFLYAARYVKHKGIEDLWQAFTEIQEEFPNDWELWCLGTGDVKPLAHPKIRHFGFVQPADMEKFIAETGVYILPSHFEPWGVSLHEFAAAGFPLICSDEVGASEKFVEHGKNGFIFPAGNIADLKKYLNRMISMTDAELIRMGEASIELAKTLTPEKWAKSIYDLISAGPFRVKY